MGIIDFLEGRKKPFVVFFFSILALKIFKDFLVLGVLIPWQWAGLLIGIALMILAIPFH